MKRMVCLLAIVVVVGGCTTLHNIETKLDKKFNPNLYSIKIGMSKNQVISLWGKPDDISTWRTDPGEEIWFYNNLMKAGKSISFKDELVKSFDFGSAWNK